jgi:hypothetical protein
VAKATKHLIDLKASKLPDEWLRLEKELKADERFQEGLRRGKELKADEWFQRSLRQLRELKAELTVDEAELERAVTPQPVVPAKDAQETIANASEPAKPKKSRKKTVYAGAQSIRARAVLKRIFPGGIYPARAELPTPQLLKDFEKEYERVEGKKLPRVSKPSDDVVLREVGRRRK